MSINFFQVGGCVRDSLMGIKPHDIDFAVEAPSFEDMLEAVERRCSKVFRDADGVPVGAEFFTLRGIDPNIGPVDFVWAREDGPSSDGRHPDWVKPGDIFADLARRDFACNAIAITDSGEIIDPHDGQHDIEHRTLRFVGTAEDRLREDALRAFRGVRFEITKGFHLDFNARAAIDRMTPDQFDAVSTERIREELLRCFAHDTAASLRCLRDFPVLFDLALDRGLWLMPTMKGTK